MGRRKLFRPEEVLAVIRRWLADHGVSPTIEELRQALKVRSKRTVHRYLSLLEEQGKLQRQKGARALKVLKDSVADLETALVPLVGRVPAGPLMVAEENIEGWLRLPKGFLRPASARFFLLKVIGDSMNKAKLEGGTIEEGDLVLVQQQAAADPGDIVIALIDGKATIKRLAKGPGYYFLEPVSSNTKHPPIILGDEARIQGKAKRVFKDGGRQIDAGTN